MKCNLEKGYTMKTILNITNKTHSRSGGEKTRGNAQKKIGTDDTKYRFLKQK